MITPSWALVAQYAVASTISPLGLTPVGTRGLKRALRRSYQRLHTPVANILRLQIAELGLGTQQLRCACMLITTDTQQLIASVIDKTLEGIGESSEEKQSARGGSRRAFKSVTKSVMCEKRVTK